PGPGSSGIFQYGVYNNKFIFQFGFILHESDGIIANNTSFTIPSTYTLQTSSILGTKAYFNFNNEFYMLGFRKNTLNNIDSVILFKISNTVTNFSKIKAFKYTGINNMISYSGILYFHGSYSNKFIIQEQNALAGSGMFIISDGTLVGSVGYTSAQQPVIPELSANSSYQNANTFIPFINNQWIVPGLTNSLADCELYTIDYNSYAFNLIKNINPSTGFQNSTVMPWSNYVVMNNKVYFLADNGTTGKELWETDGTSGGTNLLLDIYPGNTGGPFATGRMHVSGFNLFFVANDGVTGNEVWVLNNAITGVKENKADNRNITAYPNPFKNEVKINYTLASGNNEATIDLIEIASGKLIQQQNVSENKGTTLFNTENLSSGIYLVSIKQKNHPTISLKVVNIK
ncbi:MAG: T9SS type A sorting domain-containing protein, partial [Bacteroidia bacterium]